MENMKYPRPKQNDEELDPNAEPASDKLETAYPSQDEQERIRSLKEKYGFRDSVVVKGQAGKYETFGLTSAR
jgi:hypothetical protein